MFYLLNRFYFFCFGGSDLIEDYENDFLENSESEFCTIQGDSILSPSNIHDF